MQLKYFQVTEKDNMALCSFFIPLCVAIKHDLKYSISCDLTFKYSLYNKANSSIFVAIATVLSHRKEAE